MSTNSALPDGALDVFEFVVVVPLFVSLRVADRLIFTAPDFIPRKRRTNSTPPPSAIHPSALRFGETEVDVDFPFISGFFEELQVRPGIPRDPKPLRHCRRVYPEEKIPEVLGLLFLRPKAEDSAYRKSYWSTIVLSRLRQVETEDRLRKAEVHLVETLSETSLQDL